MSNEHHQKTLEAERSYHDKLESLRAENKRKEEQWASELESLRVTKDSKIRQIEREREDSRNTYELKINDLESKIRSKNFKTYDHVLLGQSQKILELQSTII